MRSISFAATTTAITLAAATAGVGLLVTAPGAASADATRSSAYGIQVSGGGEVIVPPTPYVESTDGTEKTAGGGSLPSNPLGVTATIGELSAGDDEAAVRLVDLGIAPSGEQIPEELQTALDEIQAGCDELAAQLPAEGPLPEPIPDPLQAAIDEVEAQLSEIFGDSLPLGDAPSIEDLRGFCDSFDAAAPIAEIGVLNVECDGDTGSVLVQNVSLLGQNVPVQPSQVEPDTAILPENPLLTITANRQTTTEDDGFSVDGLVVELAGGEAEAIVANATCGETIAAPAAEPNPPAAPAPAPVSGSAPVTG